LVWARKFDVYAPLRSALVKTRISVFMVHKI